MKVQFIQYNHTFKSNSISKLPKEGIITGYDDYVSSDWRDIIRKKLEDRARHSYYDYYELPAFMGYDVTEFSVSASTTDLNYFYVGAIVADSSKPDIQSRSLTTRVQGIVIDMDTDRVRKSAVKSPLPDAGKYFYFNPRIAGRGDNIAVAYQRTYTYKYLGDADACL